MNGIDYRLQTILNPLDGRALIVDTSAGLVLGALPGLDDYAAAVRPLLSQVDAVVSSPGQLGRWHGPTQAGWLVRADWTNTLRAAECVLPPLTPQYVSILTAAEALELGATGLVTTFLLGYAEELEAACLRSMVQLALTGKDLGLPLIVEVRATGPRVVLLGKAIELGASYALEGGADVIVLPYPGRDTLQNIAAFVSVPWLIKPSHPSAALTELEAALESGAAGLWLDHDLFRMAGPLELLSGLKARLHNGADRGR